MAMFGLSGDETMRLIYLMALLAFVAGGISFRRGGFTGAWRNLAVWVAIFLALVAVYAWREPVLRFAAPVLDELNPSRRIAVVETDGAQELVVRRGDDGHFHLDAAINEAPVRFLVDTGATSTALTADDAERAGIDVGALRFDRLVQTANGQTMFARAVVGSLDIGPYRLADIPVAVIPENLGGTSLLGMNVINRFAGWRVEGDRMILTP
jgi:aspartyl protease family protein